MNKTRINIIISLEDIEELKIKKIKGSGTNIKVQGLISKSAEVQGLIPKLWNI